MLTIIVTFLMLTTLTFYTRSCEYDHMITKCHESYCYHLYNSSHEMLYIWDQFKWMKLQELQKFCHEKVSPASSLLEIYREEDQRFVEDLIRTNDHKNKQLVPPIVPLNLQVSLHRNWTWIDGSNLTQLKPITFGKYLRNISGSHFAFIEITNDSFTCDQSPSFLALYKAICQINDFEYCGHLSSSLKADGYCYFIVHDLLNWHQARDFCRNKRGDLLIFNDVNILVYFVVHIQPLLIDHVGYWIGLTNLRETWLRNNDSVSYANWGSIDLSSVNSTDELVNLNLERTHWFPVLPNTFEMKIVCMTENLPINKSLIVDVPEISSCTGFIWQLVFLVFVSIGCVVMSVLYILERRRNSIRSPDQQIMFEKSTESTINIPYSNLTESSSNPATRDLY